MTIWFDMDGTIADFYAVNGWLDDLIADKTRPYEIAKPIGDIHNICTQVNRVQKLGYNIGIISCVSKGASVTFANAIADAKREWLAKEMPSVKWDRIEIVDYNQNKFDVCREGILFDDEERHRVAWKNGKAYRPNDIISVLTNL